MAHVNHPPSRGSAPNRKASPEKPARESAVVNQKLTTVADDKGVADADTLPRKMAQFLTLAGPTPVDRLADAMLSTRAEVEPHLTGEWFAVRDGVVEVTDAGRAVVSGWPAAEGRT